MMSDRLVFRLLGLEKEKGNAEALPFSQNKNETAV
jgi:hypothetical protein